MNKLFTLIKNTFYPNSEEHYDFILPENSAESVESNDEVKTDEICGHVNAYGFCLFF